MSYQEDSRQDGSDPDQAKNIQRDLESWKEVLISEADLLWLWNNQLFVNPTTHQPNLSSDFFQAVLQSMRAGKTPFREYTAPHINHPLLSNLFEQLKIHNAQEIWTAYPTEHNIKECLGLIMCHDCGKIYVWTDKDDAYEPASEDKGSRKNRVCNECLLLKL